MSPRKSNAVLVAVAFYTAIAVGALVWAFLQGRPTFALEPLLTGLPGALAVPISVTVGLILAALVVLGTPSLVARTAWAKELQALVRISFLPATRLDIAVLAIFSGVSEEVFFRGAMLPAWDSPTVGLALSSLVFGALHVGPSRSMWPWGVWAIVMGLAFGTLTLATGSVSGAIASHVAINWINLSRMLKAPTGPARSNESPAEGHNTRPPPHPTVTL